MQPLAQQVIACPPTAKQTLNAGNTRIIFHTILYTPPLSKPVSASTRLLSVCLYMLPSAGQKIYYFLSLYLSAYLRFSPCCFLRRKILSFSTQENCHDKNHSSFLVAFFTISGWLGFGVDTVTTLGVTKRS